MIVNVSNFIMRKTEHVRVVGEWEDILEERGSTITERSPVATPRRRHGANAELRVDHGAVLMATR